MKIMHCPLNGPRNISEFITFGEVADMPPPDSVDDRAWAEFLFFANNSAGVVREWWCHAPTNYWFIAERNTVSEQIIATYAIAELFPKPLNTGEATGEDHD